MPYKPKQSRFLDYYETGGTEIEETDPLSLHLDQTTPQTIVNGIPLLEEGHPEFSENHQLVDKEYVDKAVTAINVRYYMLDSASGVSDYKNTQIGIPTASGASDAHLVTVNDQYLRGWISPTTSSPTVLKSGIYSLYTEAKVDATLGNKRVRLYWKLVEYKADTSEVVIATSEDSDELTSSQSDYDIHLILASDYMPTAGSRIVGKLYADLSGSGGDPTATLYYLGTVNSRWEIPTSVEVLNSLYQPLDAELTALAGLTSDANKVPMFSGSQAATLIDFKDEDDMSSDSATAIASQQSIKAYADTKIAKSLVDAKGDLIVATSDNTPARKAVGTNYNSLIADSSQSDGLKYDIPWKYPASSPQWLAAQTFDMILRGTLSSKSSTPESITFVFGSATTDNNGIVTWTAGWTNTGASTGRYTTTAGNTATIVIRTAGTNNIVLDRGNSYTYYDSAVAVSLDGVAKTAWDQSASQTYTLSNVAAGVHTIIITAVNARVGPPFAIMCTLKSIQYYRLPYQGCGVTDDAFTVVYVQPRVLAISSGVGPTDNGGTLWSEYKCPAISIRLPMAVSNEDTLLANDQLSPYGINASAFTGSMCWVTSVRGANSSKMFEEGDTMKFGAAEDRGFTTTDADGGGNYAFGCQDITASVIHKVAAPMLVRITTAGSGSSFSVGDLALLVLTRDYNSASGLNFLGLNAADRCGDLFKIPSL